MLIKLKVHTDSNQSAIVRKADDSYEVWVKAPAQRGLANAAALQALSKALNRSVGRLLIIKGSTSPRKIVKVLG